MKIGEAKIGQTVYLPVVVLTKDNGGGSYVLVQFDEGKDGVTHQQVHYTTPVHTRMEVSAYDKLPIVVDDVVFIKFVDGIWRVADRYKETLFLTPHGWDGEALTAHVSDCYHANLKPHEGK
jgi:hypothetical protein